ncbi:hypothetical protein EVAR_98110_1 [Eumeta japonica]|uniref:Mos1 transposase HTH domain-containing protein n=1 Tax=Eumeta variegata TaxID=151549 RepID=A0A4C1XJF0_EUMVA|nr:hypothetical protein EVAR_98110_1 [Eumeta japonica]
MLSASPPAGPRNKQALTPRRRGNGELRYADNKLVAQQSLSRLRTAFGDEAPCRTTIYNWISEFKHGRVNFYNKFRTDRPSTAVNNKNLNKAERIITVALENCRTVNSD